MIELRPHTGLRRGREVDTGLDAIWLVDALHPKGKRLAFVGREPGAPLQLLEQGIAQTLIAEAQRVLAKRDAGWEGQRLVTEPPEPIAGDEDNDDGDDDE